MSSTTERLNQEGQIEKYQSPWLGGNLKQSSGELKKGSELEISGKNRYEACTRFLKDLGFKKAEDGGAVLYVDSTYENGLQVKGDFKISLTMYVDDLVTSCDKEDAYKALIAKLQDKFGISQEEDTRTFVGAQISHDYEGKVLGLNQRKYFEDTLEKFKINEAIPCFTPMKAKQGFSKERGFSEEKYQAAIKDPFIKMRMEVLGI